MERAYCKKCADYGHRAKVYTMRRKDFPRVFGSPDLCILFTSTVSHTMTLGSSSHNAQFTAILMGDVDGSWGGSAQ